MSNASKEIIQQLNTLVGDTFDHAVKRSPSQTSISFSVAALGGSTAFDAVFIGFSVPPETAEKLMKEIDEVATRVLTEAGFKTEGDRVEQKIVGPTTPAEA